MMTFTLVLPFHKDIEKLIPTLARVQVEGEKYGISEVLLCHNGAPLSVDALKRLQSFTFPGVRILHTDAKGIGAGYRLGIANATADFVILSASDLPFGWTDLESFKKVSDCSFAIGSKAHAQSEIGKVTLKRRLASILFLIVRKILLGEETPEDSQGSLLLRKELAQSLVTECLYDNYLFSLEIASLHLQKGGQVVEVSVVLENNEGSSSVSLLRDGWQMLKDLLQLRHRLEKMEPQ